MKAPDKIYLDPVVAKNPENAIRYLENEIEYIRKNALLEWAKQKQYESLTIVADNFWQEVIDKLNEL